MQQQFYARYKPPVELSSDTREQSIDVDSRPKKRKRTDATSQKADNLHSRSPEKKAGPPQIISGIATKSSGNSDELTTAPSIPTSKADGDAAQKARHSKVKSRRNKSIEVIDTTLLGDITTTIDDKHKSIRAKYQEASRISEQASRDVVEDDEKERQEALPKIQSKGLQPLPQPESVENKPHGKISALPEWLTNPVYAERTASFSDLGISSYTVNSLSRAGLIKAFAIQEAVLSKLIPSPQQHQGDICVSASTGSGKTLAYTLPIIEALRDKPGPRLRAVIVVPTRELVLQVQEVFRITGSSLKVGIAIGSKSLKEEQDSLIETKERWDPGGYWETYVKPSRTHEEMDSIDSFDEDGMDDPIPTRHNVFEHHSKIDVLICTPGRLVDHIRSTKGFTLEFLQWLVVDEADRLLDQSFQEWIDIIMSRLTTETQNMDSLLSRWHRLSLLTQRPVRKIILSATMTQDYSKLVALDLFKPILIATTNTAQPMSNIEATDSQVTEFKSATVPENLSEIAIAVKNASEKPLYLVRWIQENLRMSTGGSKPDRDFETHSSSETSSQESSSSSSDSDTESSTDVSSDSSSDSDSESDSESGTSEQDDMINNKDQIVSSLSGTTTNTSKSRDIPVNHLEPVHGMLIFTNTNENALRLYRLLILLQPSWASRISPLTKSIGTSSGRKALAAFRKRKIDILVATDLASRGLDLDQLAHVVNYDLPKSATIYVHRVGRTARAGRFGVASTLVGHHEAKWFWNEIGRSTAVGRSRKVKRQDTSMHFSESEQEAYELALERLGRETKGSIDVDME